MVDPPRLLEGDDELGSGLARLMISSAQSEAPRDAAVQRTLTSLGIGGAAFGAAAALTSVKAGAATSASMTGSAAAGSGVAVSGGTAGGVVGGGTGGALIASKALVTASVIKWVGATVVGGAMAFGAARQLGVFEPRHASDSTLSMTHTVAAPSEPSSVEARDLPKSAAPVLARRALEQATEQAPQQAASIPARNSVPAPKQEALAQANSLEQAPQQAVLIPANNSVPAPKQKPSMRVGSSVSRGDTNDRALADSRLDVARVASLAPTQESLNPGPTLPPVASPLPATGSVSRELGAASNSTAIREPSLLGKEVTTLDRAREALAGSQFNRTLAVVQQYVATFPRGDLLPEALFLRMEALERLGRIEAAKSAARRLVSLAPSSPQSARARRLIGDRP